MMQHSLGDHPRYEEVLRNTLNKELYDWREQEYEKKQEAKVESSSKRKKIQTADDAKYEYYNEYEEYGIRNIVRMYNAMKWSLSILIEDYKHLYCLSDEDVLQEMQITVWRCSQTYNATYSTFYNYAYRSIKYYFLDAVRDGKRHGAVLLTKPIVEHVNENAKLAIDAVELDSYNCGKLSLEEKCIENSITQEILQQFSEKENTLIEYLMSGMTQKEIAKEMNISQARVSQILRAIRDQIHSEFSK